LKGLAAGFQWLASVVWAAIKPIVDAVKFLAETIWKILKFLYLGSVFKDAMRGMREEAWMTARDIQRAFERLRIPTLQVQRGVLGGQPAFLGGQAPIQQHVDLDLAIGTIESPVDLEEMIDETLKSVRDQLAHEFTRRIRGVY